MTLDEYLQEPCRKLSIPFWKAQSISIPVNMKIVHDNDFQPQDFSDYSDEKYFRLYHDLSSLNTIDLDEYHVVTATYDDIPTIVTLINASYSDIQVTLSQIEIVRIKRKSFLSKFNPTTGWYVKWDDLLKENEIYAVVVKGTVSIQGLVAVRPEPDMKTSFVTWMVAAPHNNPLTLSEGETKRYMGVGGHLFAVAAQLSCKYGFGGAISGFAANNDLMQHYCKVFHAEPICMLHPYQIFIPEEEGLKIREEYDYEWTDEIY